MYALTAVEHVSLDGVMQSPGRADEDTRDGFDLGGWASRWLAADPEAAEASTRGQDQAAALLLGRLVRALAAVGLVSPAPPPRPASS